MKYFKLLIFLFITHQSFAQTIVKKDLDIKAMIDQVSEKNIEAIAPHYFWRAGTDGPAHNRHRNGRRFGLQATGGGSVSFGRINYPFCNWYRHDYLGVTTGIHAPRAAG